jgi:hypothetical protein
MKLLCFQAKRFHWKTHSKTLSEVADQIADESVEQALVVFIHAEAQDGAPERQKAVLRLALKHVKWLANKRQLRNLVLHSFAHLSGESAPPLLAQASLCTLAERLRETGYHVWITPFGYLCEWDLSVYGDSLAKVWKDIR